MADSEAAALRRIMAVAHFEEGERQVAAQYIASPVELDDSEMGDADYPTREGVYRAAVRCAAADGVLEESETAILLRLRKILSIPDATANVIDGESFPIRS